MVYIHVLIIVTWACFFHWDQRRRIHKILCILRLQYSIPGLNQHHHQGFLGVMVLIKFFHYFACQSSSGQSCKFIRRSYEIAAHFCQFRKGTGSRTVTTWNGSLTCRMTSSVILLSIGNNCWKYEIIKCINTRSAY